MFRRTSVQVRNPGGLWQESLGLYIPLGAHPRQAHLEWIFPSGMKMKFAHLEHENQVYDWQGSQVPFLGFDELTHFSESQFFYMMSRNRSMSGVPGYIRATCNPDAGSWVRKLVDWYVGSDGYPIPERSGIVRWFIRLDNEIIWADSKKELTDKYGPEQLPKSFTFIPSNIRDNKILMEMDPSYLSNLQALPRVERLRLLGGNWNVRAQAGTVFQRGWFQIIDAEPKDIAGPKAVRAWDRAATEPNEGNKDPDWTAGVRMVKTSTGVYVITHVARMRGTPLSVESFVRNIATQDGTKTRIVIEQDPGSSGVADAQNYARLLVGFDVRLRKATKDKVTRALPFSAQCEAGNVKLLKGEWNEAFLNELENFGEDYLGHDDQVDAASQCLNELAEGISILDYYRDKK